MATDAYIEICPHGDRSASCLSCRPTDPELADLLDEVEILLRRYVVMANDAHAIVTLWIAHVYAFPAAEFTPYLSVTSPSRRSGKSRLLELAELLLGPTRAVSTSNISPASLYRLIDANPGMAVLFDEIDRVPKDKAEDLWGLINSGWRLGGKAHRQTGPRMDVLTAFSTFSPKILAGIGQPLPDTVADRSLPIRMERRLQSERIDRLRLRKAGAEFAPVRDALAEWAAGAVARLAEAEPSIPSGITNDRLIDVAEPLFAIADRAGGAWSSRIRFAVTSTEQVQEQINEEELSMIALRHLLELFGATAADVLSTDEILHYMIKQDDAPFAEWWGDKVEIGKTVGPARRLRKLLAQYRDVEPLQHQMPDGRNLRGYARAPVLEAADRYLPDASARPATSATPLASAVADVALLADGAGGAS